MFFRYIACACFLLVSSVGLFAEKPIVDWYRRMDQSTPEFFERPNFIFANKGKHSDILLLSDWSLLDVERKRAEGYKMIIGYIAEPTGSMNHLLDPANNLLDPSLGPSSWIETHLDKFDLVLTFNKYLLDKYPDKCKFAHAVGFGTLFNHGIHPKLKLCSHMVSNQRVWEGHKLRWAVAEKYRAYFDACKDGNTTFVEWKDAWLNDFCFSVIIENSRESHYFSEKIIECMRAGTVPIYWGCPTIGEFFDMDGIIVFNNLNELGPILRGLSTEDYQRRLPAIKRNFELAGQYAQYRLTPCRRDNSKVVIDFENTWHYSAERPDVFDVIWPYVEAYLQRTKDTPPLNFNRGQKNNFELPRS